MTIKTPRRHIAALVLVIQFGGALAWAQNQSPASTDKREAQKNDINSPTARTAAPPQELELARLDHQSQILAASLNPLKTTLSRLDELARTRAQARDYEGALTARTERQKMEAELERIAKELLLLEARAQVLKTALLPDRILLSLKDAHLEGVRWDAEKQRLTQWERPGAFAEWSLPGLPGGGYEVLITYQCNPIEGGTLLIAEKTFTLTGEMDTTLRGPEVKNLGTLKITDGSGSLRLTARTIVKSNLMDLIAVELVPANR
jgi:hypothetical protein